MKDPSMTERHRFICETFLRKFRLTRIRVPVNHFFKEEWGILHSIYSTILILSRSDVPRVLHSSCFRFTGFGVYDDTVVRHG